MAQSKIELFNIELVKSAHYFKALAHPARLQILQFLAESNSCITADISSELPLSRTTVNQHIKELKEAGLIQGYNNEIKTKYCLNSENITELKLILQLFLDNLSIQDYKCK
ncbi:MAG: winged helix-turn-helix transcriptional regulator [Bacteroidales bacterium]|nr:winged helix-turn-helix transcriptional regulator [Bacteroidales bacterium]